ncbi:Endomembrane protein 70, partial [Globisporangium splendens]
MDCGCGWVAAGDVGGRVLAARRADDDVHEERPPAALRQQSHVVRHAAAARLLQAAVLSGKGSPEKIEYKSENLGEYLTANRIQNSPYEIKFLEDQECTVLCQQTYKDEDVKKFEAKVKNSYRVNWILDNLPVTSVSTEGVLGVGFPLGSFNPEVEVVPQLNNHVKIRIGYNNAIGTASREEGRIVDFTVIPYSFEYTDKSYIKEKNRMTSCDHAADDRRRPLYLSKNKAGELPVYWTYSVEWIEDNEKEWRTRWDIYFEAGSGSDQVHWFSIINALLIVLFLSVLVGMILMRSLHRDISRYNRVPTDEERAEEREESGWKLVHADVFRPPTKNPMLFCVMVGTGTQLLGMALVTLFFAAVGVLAPSNRGKLVIALLVVFVLLGMLAGYTSARTYKMFKGKRWQLCTILTATLFPGILFALFFFLNLFVWGAGSDAAVPFGSILLVFFLWTGISVPLVFAGAFFGFRKPASTFPVATSNIPRPIPPQAWYMTSTTAAAVGGVLPFGAIFVELFFVLSSLWTDKYYYMFGFLLLSFVILVHTCAEITIVLTYFQLCAEDYNWWWRSFLVSGSCGFYVFLYSTYYFWTRLDVGNVIGAMLYFGYMAVISGALALLTGAVGVGASLWFTRKIYASIKVD